MSGGKNALLNRRMHNSWHMLTARQTATMQCAERLTHILRAAPQNYDAAHRVRACSCASRLNQNKLPIKQIDAIHYGISTERGRQTSNAICCGKVINRLAFTGADACTHRKLSVSRSRAPAINKSIRMCTVSRAYHGSPMSAFVCVCGSYIC